MKIILVANDNFILSPTNASIDSTKYCRFALNEKEGGGGGGGGEVFQDAPSQVSLYQSDIIKVI